MTGGRRRRCRVRHPPVVATGNRGSRCQLSLANGSRNATSGQVPFFVTDGCSRP